MLTEINRRINRIRKAIKGLFLIDGLSRVVIYIASFAIATYLIDWCIPDLPREVRLFLLIFGTVSSGYVVYRYLIYPIRFPIKDDDIALCVERVYPNLNNRLISTVQLSRTIDRDPGFNSRELTQALINETNQVAQSFDFRKIIDNTLQKKIFALMCGILLIVFSYASFYPYYTGIWFNRILGGTAHWPKTTFLKLILEDDVIAKGQDVTVRVIVEKGSPKKVYLHYEFETGEKGRIVRTGKSIFKFDFLRVYNSFSVYAEGGDDQTEKGFITVLTPPRIEKILLWYEYPEYTKLSPTELSQPEIGGVIRAALGARVNFNAFSNIPLKSAQLIVGKKSKPSNIANLPIEPDILEELKKIRGSLSVTGDSEYSLYLTGKNGLPNIEPIRYPIKAIMDNAPVVKVLEPRRDNKYITPLAMVPLRVLTTDDYGINRLILNYKIVTREATEEQKIDFTRAHNNEDYDSPKIETNYNFEISALGVKEGDIIRYLIEARDNCTIPNVHITRSRGYRFTLLSRTQLEKKLEEITLRLKQEVRKIYKLQEEEKEKVARYRELFGDKEKLTQVEQRSLQRSITAQRRVTQGLDRVIREFDEVISDIRINKLWDVKTRDKLISINELLKIVAGEKSPHASELLSRATNTPKPLERMEKLSVTQNLQDEILQDLQNVLTKLEEWEDYQEVVRLVRELLLQQSRIIEEMKEKGE